MSLRIRRGTEAQRPSATFDLGEIVWTTDTNKLYVGDGVNLGGKNILATSAGTGLVWNATTQRLDFNGLGSGIINVQADTNPSLGGNLNLNSRNITGTGNISIAGTITATQFNGSVTSSGTITAPDIGSSTIRIVGNLIISTASTISGTGISSDNPVRFGDNTRPTTLWVNSGLDFGYFTGLTNGTFNSGLQFRISRGTLESPTTLIGGDATAFIQGNGYNGTNYVTTSAIGLTTDLDWNGTLGAGGQIPGAFGVVVIDIDGGQKFLSFNSRGVLDAPVSKTSVYSVASTPLPSATFAGSGAKAFVSDATATTFATAYTGGGSNSVPVYSDGTIWLIG
jgi:hypothetical protein